MFGGERLWQIWWITGSLTNFTHQILTMSHDINRNLKCQLDLEVVFMYFVAFRSWFANPTNVPLFLKCLFMQYKPTTMLVSVVSTPHYEKVFSDRFSYSHDIYPSLGQSVKFMLTYVSNYYIPHIDLPKLLMVCTIKKTNKQEFVKVLLIKSYWWEISKTYLSQKFALYSIGDYMIRQALYFRQLGMGEWYGWMHKFHRSANEN